MLFCDLRFDLSLFAFPCGVRGAGCGVRGAGCGVRGAGCGVQGQQNRKK